MKILKGFGLIGLLLLVVFFEDWRWWSWERNDLNVEVIGHWELEGISVELNPWHLIIRNADGEIVLRNVRGERFLDVHPQPVTLQEHRGMVSAEVDLSWSSCEQSVSQVSLDSDTPEVMTISGQLICSTQAFPYQLTIDSINDHQFTLELEQRSEALFASEMLLSLMFEMPTDEAAIGFGAQFSHLNMRGLLLPIIVSEQGIGRGVEPLTSMVDWTAGAGGKWHSSYAPIPWFFTSYGRAFWLNNDEPSWFDFRSSDRAMISTAASQLKMKVYLADSPKQFISEFTADTGRMSAPPTWVDQGLIAGVQGGSEAWSKIDRLRAAGVPLAGVWLQDWVGQRKTSFGKQLWWNWALDTGHYPHWQQQVELLAEADIRVLGYLNPFLVESPRLPAEEDMWHRLNAVNAFVEDVDGEPIPFPNTSFSANLVDLFQPAASELLQQEVRAEIDALNWSGWMADFAEAYPGEGGAEGLAKHNRYPVLWSQFNQELAHQLQIEEPLIWHRSAFTGSAGVGGVFWLGDQLVDWDEHDGIKSAVTGLLSASLSGLSVNHSDIGGYTTIDHPLAEVHRSPELLKRWLELNAFGLIFRSHEGNLPDVNAQIYDEELLASTRAMTEVFSSLGSYRRHLYDEMERTGIPPVRHPLIEYPDVTRFWGLRYEQFFLGSDLLVAPVLDKGVDEVVVIIPPGEWRHWWTGNVYSGTSAGKVIKVAAPIGQPAAFTRIGGVLDE
ncbi:alpha-glucosidase [uncultured Umboniibacter sp.]|uniref:alpha-glucosidase n=1 Tax=uncultured Umboniibacter sp. TaxID=1798917 RepID=UPI002609A883|nr:alpha-glucosidase [uncultured Umboniibacter sp.]